MANVASWSGTKTLTCFEYYDQAYADYFNPGRGQFSGLVHINWATMKNTANGPTMDAPTTRGPFKDIENEGYLGNNSGLYIFHLEISQHLKFPPARQVTRSLGHPKVRFFKKNDIFKIVIQLDRPVQYEKFEAFQEKIRRVTDQYEHFGTRFLRLYNKDKRLDFAVDLAKLDQKGIIYTVYITYQV